MSYGSQADIDVDKYVLDRKEVPGGRRRIRRSSGHRRVMITAGLLFVVVCVLVVIGPAALRPPGQRDAILPGLTIEDTGSPKGLVITSIQSNSIADDAGIQVGDRIVGLDAQKVSSRAEARRYLDQKHPPVVDMKLAREGRPMEVIYAFPKRNSQ
jgi:membrane-associated protease RseP (regulator of RpoE activity)